MRYFLVAIFLLSFSFDISSQSFRTVEDGKLQCWRITPLTDSIDAEVLEFFPNPVLCGKFPTASIIIVKTSNDDTIRVLQFCIPPKDLKIGDKIIVYYSQWFDHETVLLPTDKRALSCKPETTIRGAIRTQRFE